MYVKPLSPFVRGASLQQGEDVETVWQCVCVKSGYYWDGGREGSAVELIAQVQVKRSGDWSQM